MGGFHADHVGALLAPQALKQAQARYGEGRIDAEALTAAEDEAVVDLLRLQGEAGVAVFTDGQARRMSWTSALRAGGAQLEPRCFRAGLRPSSPTVANDSSSDWEAALTGGLSLGARLTGGEGDFLRRHAPGPFKIAIPSPNAFLGLHQPGVTDRAYEGRRALLDDLVRLCAREVQDVVREGAAYVQLDTDTDVYGRALAQSVLETGCGEAGAADAVAAENEVLAAARAAGVVTGVHIRRASTGLRADALGELLLGLCDADRLLLDFGEDDPDAFELLRLAPRGKTVVLGLVPTSGESLPHRDALRRRIDRAARFIDLEHLAISPQAGFAPGARVGEDDQKRKLELVAETARAVWG